MPPADEKIGDLGLLQGSGNSTVKVRNLTRGTWLGDRVEIARTSRERRRGLLGRQELPEGCGLWIAPCEGIHTFSMRFPIDVIFLDRHRRVLSLRTELHPGRIAVCLRAHSVLELPAGTIGRSQTRVGDQLEFLD